MTALRLIIIAVVPFALVFTLAWEFAKWIAARRRESTSHSASVEMSE